MTLSQLEYVLAVDRHRHFVTAAEKCFVTQATLSMMIRKLEAELDMQIFDRSRHPVRPTREGEQLLVHARKVISEISHLKSFADEMKGGISGSLHLGIIPTLAPYLLPLFLKSFSKKFPGQKIHIREMITDEIIAALKSGELEAGLLATPLHDREISEQPLFYEEFYAYVSGAENLPRKKYLLPADINPDHLWLLEEGHCLRNQVFNLCELKKKDTGSGYLHYEAGSIETLINLVDRHRGITIIPQLAMMNLKKNQQKQIREFGQPKPAREISLVTRKNNPRKKLLEALSKDIIESVPAAMREKERKKIANVV